MIIPILGMHRSGTSLLANWLYHCGLNIGEKLLGADHFSNKTAHYEDLDFFHLHVDILKNHDLGYLTGYKQSITFSEEEKNKIVRLIHQKQLAGKDWGWKEPRTCLFLPVYEKHLPEDNFNIAVFRHYREVVGSLYRREFKQYSRLPFIRRNKIYAMILWNRRRKINSYLSTWINYNRHILEFIEKKKFIIVSNDDILQLDRAMFLYITEKIGISGLTYFPINDIFQSDLMKSERTNFSFDRKLISEADKILEKLNFLRKKSIDQILNYRTID